VIESPNSIIYDQSENRLYSAKGILLKILGEGVKVHQTIVKARKP